MLAVRTLGENYSLGGNYTEILYKFMRLYNKAFLTSDIQCITLVSNSYTVTCKLGKDLK